ncbi:Retroelement pol Polyprotein [Phytophthora cinnamomi]|uniref:Retroelement pol Polyprotein n=1 Tax=Phytophthora cinnamomi TaxID=4785 RepID=UPI00355A2461|nr:Retroelement pol Polyprotein [Phytophthora cinnamomi]
MGDSVELYFDQVIHYFEAKNIDWQDENQSKRIIAMMTANFRGNAAAWYMLCRDSVSDVQDLIQKLTKEFVPPDLQERLRDRLYSLKQKRCSSLEDYISLFRVAIMQVKDMSELDKITYFIRGLVSPTKEEVQYRRCTTVSEALSVALEYDRSHFRAE